MTELPAPVQLHEDLELCVPEYGPMRSYMLWAIKTTDAEHLFHLGSILPCLANEAVTSGFVVDEQRRIRPTLWSFMVGVPASAKSTARQRATKLYTSYLSTRAGKEVADPFIFAEGSWPGIFEALTERFDPETGLATGIFSRDEAARLLDTKDTTISDNLCNLIDGDEIKRHLRGYKAENRTRPGSAPDRLRAPAFSGCLSTTFARIREVTQASYVEGGLYSRFLWFVGMPHLPEQQLDVDMHETDRRRVLDEWLDWGKWLLGMSTLRTPEERVVTFTPDVEQLLRDTLFATLNDQRRTDSRMNATRKRGLTQAKIVAGLYALSCQRTTVDYEDMVRAINLVEMSTQGLDRLDQSFLPSASSRDQITLAHKAFETIKALSSDADGCPKASLYRQLQVPKFILDSVIDTLLDEGSIAQVAAPKLPGQSGRPAMLYRVTRPSRFGTAPKRVSSRKHLRLVVADETSAGVAEAPPEPLDGSDEPK